MSEQVKFLAGKKLDLANKASQSGLTPGALYFCTDEKKIYKATANNTYEAVNEEVSFGVLPEAASAFPGKLYLRQADMTLHVLNAAGDAFKQLSAPANALVPDNVSDDLNADDKKLLASKTAVKAGIKVVADDLADEINDRKLGDTNTLAAAKKYADDQDKILVGDYNTAGEGLESNASGLRGEIESRIKAEKDRAELAEKGLTDKIAIINGTGEGSIKAAVKAEADRAKGEEARIEGLVTTEKSARIEADTALDTRITKLEGDANTPGSVASQIKNVQEQVNDIKDKVGHEAVKADEEHGIQAQDATGLFAKLDEEKARAEAAEKANAAAIKAEETRATTKEEANAKAIADEQTRAMAAEKANADAITILNGADTVEGSVKKQIKDAVGAEATLRIEKDNELQGAINTINEALGLGEGVTGGISDRLSTVEGKTTTLEGKVSTLEGKTSALETAVGTKKADGQEATGLYKDIDDLQAKDTSLQASIDTLNGGVEVAGSVAKAVADEATLRAAEDKKLDDRLKVVEDLTKEGGGLELRVAENERKLSVIQGEGEGSIKKAVADLVNGAPTALDTLKELADALGNDENFAATVATQIGEKVDKVEGSRLVSETEIAKWNAKAETSYVDQAEADANDYTDEKVGDLSTLKTDAKGSAVSAINELKDNISAINNADTGILKQAKDYTDGLIGNYNTAPEGQTSNASGLRGDIESKIAAEKTARVEADTDLQGQINDINDALDLGGATGSVGNRLSNLETAVGAPAVEGDPGTPATGLYKDVADLKAADTALDGRLDSLEGVVGDSQSGLVKDVVDNTAAIDAINHETTGILAQAKADATSKANTAQANAEAEAARLDGLLKTEIEKDDGVLMTAIKTAKAAADAAQDDVDTIENRLDAEGGLVDRLEAVEASIGNGGNLEARVTAVEAKAEANKTAIGDANSGLTKKVNDNTAAIATNAANISSNTAAIEIINGGENQEGSIAKALKDANAYTDEKIGKPSVPGKDSVPGTDATGLHKVIEDGDADTLADAKTYTDKAVADAVGTASVPGEGEAQGTAATGLHKVIEDGDTAAKEYADNVANTAVTEALTWGSF